MLIYNLEFAVHLAGILAERRDTRPIFGQNIAFFWKLLEALFNLSVGFTLQPAYLDVGALKTWNVNLINVLGSILGLSFLKSRIVF